MHPNKAGIYELHGGTKIHICDCDTCLRKHGGKPKQVHRNTYFAHKPARTARLFPPPPPTASEIVVAAVPSSSKRSLDMCDDNEQEPAPRKKGRQRDIHSDLSEPDNHILHDSDNDEVPDLDINGK
jgi:hypothetical protein